MGKFEIYQSEKSQDYYFRLKAGNGEIILSSQGYNSKDACKNGVESCQKNASSESSFEMKTAENGKSFFNLKAANGQVIGKSQMYADNGGASNGMKSVMTNCADSTVEDLTA